MTVVVIDSKYHIYPSVILTRTATCSALILEVGKNL